MYANGKKNLAINLWLGKQEHNSQCLWAYQRTPIICKQPTLCCI